VTPAARSSLHPAGADPAWPDDAVEVGRIVDAWGLKGWIKVQPFASDPQALFSSRRWFILPSEKDSIVRPASVSGSLPTLLRITQVKDHGDVVVALAQEVPDRNAAEAMRGARVFIEVYADLADARQWVHDDHFLLGGFHDLRVDHVGALDLFVIGGIFEAFLLDARHIQHVGFGQHVLERVEFCLRDPFRADFVHHFPGHAQNIRRDVIDPDLEQRQPELAGHVPRCCGVRDVGRVGR